MPQRTAQLFQPQPHRLRPLRRNPVQRERRIPQRAAPLQEKRLRRLLQFLPHIVEAGIEFGHPVFQVHGHGSRRFQRNGRDQIGHALVFIMSDPGDHRQRELRQVTAQPIAVEAPQIALRTAPSDQHQRIETIRPVGRLAQCPDDRLLGFGPLHESVEQRNFESVGRG